MGSLRTVEIVGGRVGLHLFTGGIAVWEWDAGSVALADHDQSVCGGQGEVSSLLRRGGRSCQERKGTFNKMDIFGCGGLELDLDLDLGEKRGF